MYKKIYISIIVLGLLTQVVFGQDSSKTSSPSQLTFRAEAAYIVGGQIYNDNFLYNNGSFLSITASKIHSHDLHYGLGAGLLNLQYELFIPIYIDIKSYKKKSKNSSFFNTQAGYAYGSHSAIPSVDKQSFSGGIYISAGTGKKIALNDSYSLSFQWAYKHQFAKMAYRIYGGTHYSEILNYDMISISAALLIH